MDKPVKVRFSGLDAVIIALVLIAAAVAVWFFGGSVGGSPVEIDYVVEFRGVNDTFRGVPVIGGTVYDSDRGHYIGVVTNVEYQDTVIYNFNQETLEYRKEVVPNELDVFLSISAEGTETDDYIAITGENIEIRVGTKMNVKGKGYANEGYIVEVATRDKGE